MAVKESTAQHQGRDPLRVLLVVDSLYWTVGHFARQVVKNNPQLNAVICSQHVIREFQQRYGQFPLSFDLVHFLNTKTMEPFCGRLPTVTTFHHMDSNTHVKYLDDCDAVMTVSTQWQQYLIDVGIPCERLGIVPFAVDGTEFYPASQAERSSIRQELNISTGAFVVGFAGRRTSDVDGRKGLACFLESVKTLRQSMPQLVIVMIGPGWEQLVRQLQSENIAVVHVSYQLDHTAIARLYRALDVFWVTSRIEGGPVPLLEAMASGLPCVSTPVGAVLDLVHDHKNGFIVPFDDSQAFVDMTVTLERNRDLIVKIGEAARETILRKRSWSQTQVCLGRLYETAINNYHTRRSVPLSDRCSHTVFQQSSQPPVPTAACFDDLDQKVKQWIRACEYVRGSKMLIQLGEWRQALQLMRAAVKESPGDLNIAIQIVSVFFHAGKKRLRWRTVKDGARKAMVKQKSSDS
ncbi:glycosyltransferase family 4 protein [Nitrospira sp. M1]